jgi:hypothetical protein
MIGERAFSTQKWLAFMSLNATLSPNSLICSIELLKDEVCCLVERRIISRDRPLYILCEYLPARECLDIECILERCDYLLRDRVGDLIGEPNWIND